MSAITAFLSCLSLAGASVKRKISELKGAELNASWMRKQDVGKKGLSWLKTVLQQVFGSHFDMISKTGQNLKPRESQLLVISSTLCCQWIDGIHEDCGVCSPYQRPDIFRKKVKCVLSLSFTLMWLLFKISLRPYTWIIERYQNIEWGFIICSHFAADYRGCDVLHCCNVITHAVCGVDHKTQSFTGSPEDAHHPEGLRENKRAFF